ncbi:GNAT family N-acetyltransferase [Niallia taxi]|uniref:GNAT family N-acetyltransferase n=2 Tax=Niallia taxi TaxID=2499688 RepID=UPI002E1F2A7B|nr:GNAT family N-acetyltransferase [Niallia taxi]
MTNKKIIRKIEELSMNALPALQTQLYDGWVVRFADGYTKRANSINPIYFSKEDVHDKIETVEQMYRKKNLKVVYKMTKQVSPENLDFILEESKYIQDSLTSVQTLSLQDVQIELKHHAIVYNDLQADWFRNFCKLNTVKEQDRLTLNNMLNNIIAETRYFQLTDESNEIVACGMCVLENNCIGLFDIVTSEKQRNRGYGFKLIQSILQWGKENGARLAYLQVMLNNPPALKLYSKLGFKEVYQYWYRIKA